MINDRSITISIGNSCKALLWAQQTMTIGELYEKLRTPIRTTETMAEYQAMKKADRDALKDVGGFVGGKLAGGRRKAANVLGRDLVTLDLDHIDGPRGLDAIIKQLDSINCSYCIYSTRSSTPEAPRLRILLPTHRTMSVDEYEPVARWLAGYIGIKYADPTTFEAHRLMYWPSCSSDSQYVYRSADGLFCNVEAILGQYKDWHDVGEWPQVPGADKARKTQQARQGDPRTRPGIIGAFNRCYDIEGAIAAFIPEAYTPCGDGRLTYTGGSTTGGAVLYEDGQFLFSHHATDPCSGKLVNAFDLVRLHKFGSLDDGVDLDVNDPVAVKRLPSFKRMCEFANEQDAVAVELHRARAEEAAKEFEGVKGAGSGDGSQVSAGPADATADDNQWILRLARNPQTGAYLQTIDNVITILECDPLLRDRFAVNDFSGLSEVLGALPWSTKTRRRLWGDEDSNGLYWYLEVSYNITKRTCIDAALEVHSHRHSFNELTEYLDDLSWDGTPRLDTLLVDYLGAEDSVYTRDVTRKMFTAAVARAYEPGRKFDNMLILCGPQGIGKSMLLDKMSLGFFNDSITTFEGKEASELLQGVWLVEVAELDAFRKSDVSRIKQFLSMQADRYRAAYAHHVGERPRRCVFFGTSNKSEFLQDTTGNRRFWPVDVGGKPHALRVMDDLTDDVIRQLWAEAKQRYLDKEDLFLSGAAEDLALEKQELHRETLAQEGLIRDFVDREVPEDWADWPLDRRRDYWAGAVAGDVKTVPRTRVCALEIWCEMYGRAPMDIDKARTREINGALERFEDWKRNEKVMRFPVYGVQRGFTKVISAL